MEAFHSIVVPTDFSPLSEAAVGRASMLARLEGSSVHLVHAAQLPLVFTHYEVETPRALWDGAQSAASERLEATRQAVERSGVKTVTAELSDALDAVEAIQSAAAAFRADLVVMGTHGRGALERAFLGSVTERTLCTLDTPVMAVKEDITRAAEPIRRVLLAVDFSTHAARATELAADLASRLEARVDVVHAYDLPAVGLSPASDLARELEQKIRSASAEGLERTRERLRAAHVPVECHVRRGDASSVIADLARELGSQLIVMGTRGNTGLAYVLLGSVAARTMRLSSCSVLAVKDAS